MNTIEQQFRDVRTRARRRARRAPRQKARAILAEIVTAALGDTLSRLTARRSQPA